ncbi:glycosyltransferase, partial [Acinetobacter baumannii]
MARRIQRPWIAEYRDLFAGNPYSDRPGWRRSLDHRIEKATLSTAAAVVAVTPHAADELRRVHHKPTYVVMNGFDEAEQFSSLSPPN